MPTEPTDTKTSAANLLERAAGPRTHMQSDQLVYDFADYVRRVSAKAAQARSALDIVRRWLNDDNRVDTIWLDDGETLTGWLDELAAPLQRTEHVDTPVESTSEPEPLPTFTFDGRDMTDDFRRFIELVVRRMDRGESDTAAEPEVSTTPSVSPKYLYNLDGRFPLSAARVDPTPDLPTECGSCLEPLREKNLADATEVRRLRAVEVEFNSRKAEFDENKELEGRRERELLVRFNAIEELQIENARLRAETESQRIARSVAEIWRGYERDGIIAPGSRFPSNPPDPLPVEPDGGELDHVCRTCGGGRFVNIENSTHVRTCPDCVLQEFGDSTAAPSYSYLLMCIHGASAAGPCDQCANHFAEKAHREAMPSDIPFPCIEGCQGAQGALSLKHLPGCPNTPAEPRPDRAFWGFRRGAALPTKAPGPCQSGCRVVHEASLGLDADIDHAPGCPNA